jgi:hypothetical protein
MPDQYLQNGLVFVEDARELERELNELRDWKRSAVEAIPDFQAIGKELELPVASSVSDAIIPGIQRLKRELAEVTAKNVELQGLFNRRWEADMQAIKKWQCAHPGKALVWPDHGDLVVWLTEQLTEARAQRDRLASATKLLMAIIGPKEAPAWADDNQIEAAWQAGDAAIAAVKGGAS